VAEVLAVITPEPIDPRAADVFVLSTENGAVVSFQGVVRDHDENRAVTSLDYQAHPDAERFLRECCEDVAARTGLRVAAFHRTGPLQVGDVALVAAAAAPHRAEAFAACSELVELIKQTVPIWKRQHFPSGSSEWVGL
jgi:molybdopterin synthase catalytic subunit